MSFSGSWSLGVSGTVGNPAQPMQTLLSLVLSFGNSSVRVPQMASFHSPMELQW